MKTFLRNKEKKHSLVKFNISIYVRLIKTFERALYKLLSFFLHFLQVTTKNSPFTRRSQFPLSQPELLFVHHFLYVHL